MTLWAQGRYESVAEHISDIAVQTVEAADRRSPLAGAAVVDLACGTGSAALAAAARGARVTGVDLTPELLDLAKAKANGTDVDIRWVAADAADTGLPSAAFDVVVSNMGIIFVEPDGQVAELRRLLKPDGVLAFSAWVRVTGNPLSDPIAAVFAGAPVPAFTPDQWGDPEQIERRLAAGFGELTIDTGVYTWRFENLDAALRFVQYESPLHLAAFARCDTAQREALAEAFAAALREHIDADGAVRFDSPYAVVTARRGA
ncbi:class I SAM-dependent methyltransferase [Mycolicibacterium confluentis]|uniref:SAM-dependent methyltransferase n=1 Tax=Mycolicibacterium confluentis TaxID=28047 RepID=A0A7I7XZJ9_9MYCO|nr:class I SAM-dependent methyltransferase [Mycolicibacterium confluentis]MCV7319785.1 methyltransferase domain-containing protein [Mycolicibacterium confluentis]ORV34366.1 SAM-dependent methyltransferase [Mycolicibacterium confluentis]BBZ34815.1 SAM-dependent methyltransferase [Mycolicibacterium confluentis]